MGCKTGQEANHSTEKAECSADATDHDSLLSHAHHAPPWFVLPRGPSLDNLVGADQQRLGDRQAERLGGLGIDDQLERGGLLDREVPRLGTLQNLVHVAGGAVEEIGEARAIAYEGTGLSELA